MLCGSSQNMMYGLFLDSTAPLYGRADEIMRLAPIRLPYIQEALHLNAMNAIEEYAVWGQCTALLGIEGKQKFA